MIDAWTTYEIASGRIGAVNRFAGNALLEFSVPDGFSALPGESDPATEWVTEGAITPRPLTAIEPVEGMASTLRVTIDGLPVAMPVAVEWATGIATVTTGADGLVTLSIAGLTAVRATPDWPATTAIWTGDAAGLDAGDVPHGVPTVADLSGIMAEMRAEAVAQVNAAVGAARRRYITDLPMQGSVYAAKEEEGLRYLSLSDPDAVPPVLPADLSAFPRMTQEIGVTGPTPWHVAQVWANLGAFWRQIDTALEGIRIRGVAAAQAATSKAGLAAARAAFEAELTTVQ